MAYDPKKLSVAVDFSLGWATIIQRKLGETPEDGLEIPKFLEQCCGMAEAYMEDMADSGLSIRDFLEYNSKDDSTNNHRALVAGGKVNTLLHHRVTGLVLILKRYIAGGKLKVGPRDTFLLAPEKFKKDCIALVQKVNELVEKGIWSYDLPEEMLKQIDGSFV